MTSTSSAASVHKNRKTKLELMISRLNRPGGATIADLARASGWQAHSVRGALAGALRKKGHDVTSEKADGTRRYRLAAKSGE